MSRFLRQLKVEARINPERVAMSIGWEHLTWSDLERASHERAVALRLEGVTRGACETVR
ncbi:MAG: hypothetical protein ACO1OB_28295 [Archangium sp.]